MKEFWFWVLIVTFLLALLCFSIALALYADRTVRKAEIILQRAEQVDRKVKTFTLKEKDEE